MFEPARTFSGDHELERQVFGFLRDLDYSASRDVAVHAGGRGVLTLRGCVRTSYLRQVFVQCCRCIPGVTRVVDELRVGP